MKEKTKKMEKKKKRGKKGKQGGNCSKKKGKYHYFVSLFNIGPYDRKKVCKETDDYLAHFTLNVVGLHVSFIFVICVRLMAALPKTRVFRFS